MNNDTHSNKILIPTVLVILLLLGVVIVAILNNRTNSTNTTTTVTNTANTTQTTTSEKVVSSPVSTEENSTTPTTIEISNMTFVNGTITIKQGTTVKWTNNDMLSHSVVANDGSFESVILASGKSYEHTFNSVGEFMYHCGVHPQMSGKIIVE